MDTIRKRAFSCTGLGHTIRGRHWGLTGTRRWPTPTRSQGEATAHHRMGGSQYPHTHSRSRTVFRYGWQESRLRWPDGDWLQCCSMRPWTGRRSSTATTMPADAYLLYPGTQRQFSSVARAFSSCTPPFLMPSCQSLPKHPRRASSSWSPQSTLLLLLLPCLLLLPRLLLCQHLHIVCSDSDGILGSKQSTIGCDMPWPLATICPTTIAPPRRLPAGV